MSLTSNASSINISDVDTTSNGSSQPGRLTYTSIFQIVLCVVAIFSNLGFLIVASVEPALRKRVTYVFLRHISFSYLLFGLLVAIFRVTNMIGAAEGWKMTKYVCTGFIGLSVATAGCGVTGLFFIALNMLLVMLNIQKKKVAITFRLAWILVAFAWIFWIGEVLVGIFLPTTPADASRPPICFFGSGYQNGTYITVTCVLLLGTYLLAVAVQTAVPFILRKNMKDHQKERLSHQNDANEGIENQRVDAGSIVAGRAPSSDAQNRMIQRRLAATRSMLMLSVMLLIFYTISWCPYLFALFVFMVCPKQCGWEFSVPVNAAVTVIFSAALSVFALTIKDKEFRQAACKVFCRKKAPFVGMEMTQNTT